MNRATEIVNERYDALMFAKDAESARKAARELVKVLLGEEALKQPLDEALRQCCRQLRPSADPREQARFEEEFIEIGIWPTRAREMAA